MGTDMSPDMQMFSNVALVSCMYLFIICLGTAFYNSSFMKDGFNPTNAIVGLGIIGALTCATGLTLDTFFPSTPIDGSEAAHLSPFGMMMVAGIAVAGACLVWFLISLFACQEKAAAGYADMQ